MGVFLQGLHGLSDISGVPELHLAVVPTAGQVVLPVGVEVEVPHQLPVGVLYAVYLAAGESEGSTQDSKRVMTTPHCRLALSPVRHRVPALGDCSAHHSHAGWGSPVRQDQLGCQGASVPLTGGPRLRLLWEHLCDPASCGGESWLMAVPNVTWHLKKRASQQDRDSLEEWGERLES